MVFRKKRNVLLASIAILLLLMILDITFNKEGVFEAFGEQFTNEQRTDEYQEAHQAVTRMDQRQLEIERANINEVSLSNTRGDISVKRAEGNTIKLAYVVTVTDRDDADRKLEEVVVEQEITNGRLTLFSTLEKQRINSSSVSIDYQLFVPDDMKLWIESENGSIHIDGTKGDVDASSYNGLMEIVHVEGNLTVKSSYHHIFMSDIKGSIELENNASDANIEQVDGAITLDSEDGTNFMIDIKGGITAKADFGSVHLRNIEGPVEVRSRHSDIQLGHIRNHIKVESDYGEVSMILPESEGYTLDAKVTNDSIQTHLPLPIETMINGADESRIQGVIGSGTWQVEVNVKAAQLTIH